MADSDLDKYLEDLGIGDEEENASFELPRDEADSPLVSPPVPETVSVSALGLEGTAAQRCETFLVNLLINFDPAYAVEIARSDEDEIQVDIFGGDSGKIIGRGGRTLAALEYLTNSVVNREEAERVRINIDVGGYKRRRDDRLRTTARQAASRVRKTGLAVELDPMTAAERRIVHMEIADDPSVASESTGDGRDRRVVVKPS